MDRIAESHRGIPAGAAERFAVLHALEVAIQRGYSRVKVRTDYNRMRRMLRDDYRRGVASDGDDLDHRILQRAGVLEWVEFGWVPRRKNQIAHRLARQACVPERARRVEQ